MGYYGITRKGKAYILFLWGNMYFVPSHLPIESEPQTVPKNDCLHKQDGSQKDGLLNLSFSSISLNQDVCKPEWFVIQN